MRLYQSILYQTIKIKYYDHVFITVIRYDFKDGLRTEYFTVIINKQLNTQIVSLSGRLYGFGESHLF